MFSKLTFNVRRTVSGLNISGKTNSNITISKGRFVSTYNLENGITKLHIPPRYGKPVAPEEEFKLLEPLLNEISGKQEINKLILLLAPTTKPYTFQKKLHIFDADTIKHLGSTCITTKELELIQKFEMLLKYEIVYTEEKMSIISLACNDSIISRMLKRSRQSPESKITIKSLRDPKIPVRMRASDIKRTQNADESDQPIWKL